MSLRRPDRDDDGEEEDVGESADDELGAVVEDEGQNGAGGGT